MYSLNYQIWTHLYLLLDCWFNIIMNFEILNAHENLHRIDSFVTTWLGQWMKLITFRKLNTNTIYYLYQTTSPLILLVNNNNYFIDHISDLEFLLYAIAMTLKLNYYYYEFLIFFLWAFIIYITLDICSAPYG